MAPKPKLVDDPNTFIPPAVRRMAAQADNAFRAPPGQPPAEPDASPGAAPSEAPPVTPEVTPSPGAAPPAPASFEQPVTPEVTPPPKPEETWERQYHAILNRYKRAENDIQSMSSQISNLQSLIATMQSKTTETPAELRPQSLLTPEEVNEYGSEFPGVVPRRAKGELKPGVAPPPKHPP